MDRWDERRFDFVVDAPVLEMAFFAQLAIGYEGLLDIKNKDISLAKVKEIKQKNKL